MNYSEIFSGLFCNIAASSIMIPVQEKVKNYFSNKESRTIQSSDESIGIPLAVGYYFNMLDKIEDLLKGDNLILKEHHILTMTQVVDRFKPLSTEPNNADFSKLISTLKIQETELLGHFDYSQIKLKVIYPKELSNRNLRECSFYLNEKTRRATLESVTAGRTYGINFIADDDQLSGITIVDYARPIEVIYKYFNDFKGYSNLSLKENIWKEKVEQEMQSFWRH